METQQQLTVRESRDIAMPEIQPDVLAGIVLAGDLSKLKSQEKVDYYIAFCARVGLDPTTQPFAILKLNGKEKLYCDRGGCAQLNSKHKVSHKIVAREVVSDCYVVTAQAGTPGGRITESIGAVPIKGLVGEALCNAMMKAETKAKRRSTLDLLGLGMLDESEIHSIPGAGKEDISANIAALPHPVSFDPVDAAKPTQGQTVAAPTKSDTYCGEGMTEAEAWETKIHFGKNKGKRLRELTPNQREYYSGEWMQKPHRSPADRMLALAIKTAMPLPSDAQPAAESDMEPASDFRVTRIHFGKNRGLMLMELSAQQIHWYETEWMPKKQENGPTSVEDLALINALKTYQQWRAGEAIIHAPRSREGQAIDDEFAAAYDNEQSEAAPIEA